MRRRGGKHLHLLRKISRRYAIAVATRYTAVQYNNTRGALRYVAIHLALSCDIVNLSHGIIVKPIIGNWHTAL